MMMANDDRKTFVLKCDKPRYDGGVEVDLERYFGRRLQPNLGSLKGLAQAHLDENQLHSLGRDAIKKANHQAKRNVSKKRYEQLFDDYNSYDMDDALAQGLAQEEVLPVANLLKTKVENTKTTVKSKEEPTPLMLPTHSIKHERLKEAFFKGPMQMTVGLTGVLTSMLAICSLHLCARPEGIRSHAKTLLWDSQRIFMQGILNTLLLPSSALRAIMF